MHIIQQLLHDLDLTQNTIQKDAIYNALMTEIQYILFRIQLCADYQQTGSFFDSLDDIQLALARGSNRGRLQLPAPLQQFIVDFDNLYDQHTRQQLYEQISKNQYIYGDLSCALSKILDDIEQGIVGPRFTEAQQALISNQIQSLFKKIFDCKQFAEAEPYFAKLDKLQCLLACAVFKYEIDLNQFLRLFINDFDRIDDSWTRNNLFNRIKEGRYNI